MNRSDLHRLAASRVAEAKTLRSANMLTGAYYLLGYALECAIKARIASQVREQDFPDLALAQKSHKHDLEALLSVAGLTTEFRNRVDSSPVFKVNWGIAKDWSPSLRYQADIEEDTVDSFFEAVLAEPDGVFPWLKTLW